MLVADEAIPDVGSGVYIEEQIYSGFVRIVEHS